MHKIDSINDDTWFCDLEHLYAYKAAQDVVYNPNYNLWIRVRHYTESTRNAGHAYNLNQSRIFRLAKIWLGESNQNITAALEPQANDQLNQEYSNEDISLIIRAPNIPLSDTEQEDLQRILQESFDTSHPDFDHHRALENLKKGCANKVALCKSCFLPRQKTELEQYDSYCPDCYEELYPQAGPSNSQNTSPLTPKSDSELKESSTQTNTDQSEIIKLLQQQVEQQAQTIALLRTQVHHTEQQAYAINELKQRVEKFEQFYQQIGVLCQQQFPMQEQSDSTNTTLNF